MSTNDTPMPSRKLKVKYDQTSALYANQFIVNTSNEELFVDFSSGAISDPATGESLVPVHTRIALSYGGAKRLQTILAQAIAKQEASGEGATYTDGGQSGGRLPQLED